MSGTTSIRAAAPPALTITPRRPRQTPRPDNTFKEVLRSGAQELLSGAQVATRIAGLPVLSAAISRANQGLAPSAAGAGGALAGLGTQLSGELQLLALQNEIQRQNRQMMLISNVMKARHETAKSAIANIRA